MRNSSPFHGLPHQMERIFSEHFNYIEKEMKEVPCRTA